MPSNKILEEKKQVVESLAAKMQTAAAGVLVKYEGIKVSEDTELRAALRKAGVDYTVMKNTLTGRACDIAGYGDMKQYLSGMTAIAMSQEDPLAPAKIMKQFADKIASFEIKAGFMDGEVIDASKVDELAKLPSKEGLLSMLLSVLNGPIRGLAVALNAIVEKDGEAAPAEEAAAE